MVFPRARVVVSALLFLGWISFLAYLAAVTRDPIILSRPQFLITDLCVLGKIELTDGRPSRLVKVVEVLWPTEKYHDLTNLEIEVNGLDDVDAPPGWVGPDVYLLPLTVHRGPKGTTYELTELPPMAGFQRTLKVYLETKGATPEAVARQLQESLGLSAEQAKTLVGSAPCTIKRFLPLEPAFALKKELGKQGAEVHVIEYEVRIYRATDEVLRQFHHIKP